MDKPLVSIVIPVYKGENFLREAIESALSQTYANIEVVVINDGSEDEGATEKIALSYGEKIHYFSKENGGVATALNLAISELKGEYFSWLSHDDLYYSNKIEKQIQALIEHGDMKALVHSDYDLLDVNVQTITHVCQSKTYTVEQLENSVFPVLQGMVHGCSLLIHKSHFERVGIFDENLITTQDYELWFRMFRHQKTIYIAEPLICSRLHAEQGSRTLECHDRERDELYIYFIKSLTEDEMCSMFGTSYNFYHRMSCFFKGGKMEESYKYVNKKYQEAKISENMSEELNQLQDHIKKLSHGKANRICIFCAGQWGIRLYNELRSKLISIDWFSDNNTDRWGYILDNIYCISPKQLEMEKKHTLVIVATRAPAEILKQLEVANFPYVITKQELEGILFKTAPAKWITALDNIEDIDYSSEDVQCLINKFNQVIFDICKYYQDRVRK